MDFLGLLFPAKCVICDKVLEREESGVCAHCRERLPRVTEPVCRHCGKPIADVRESQCFDCSKKRSDLEQGRALWLYTEQMKKAIADFKYRGHLISGDFYAAELVRGVGEWIRQSGVQCLIPVPLYKRKQWFRGFNQAAYLAERLGEHMGLPVCEVLVREYATKPQKGLDNRQRAHNLRGVFGIREDLIAGLQDFHSVLLVDDIYTTGATLEECARTIKKYGNWKVYSICLCIGKDF